MTATKLPPFRTSPSHIARYFFHDCDRFLRFSCTRSDLATGQGIPKSKFDTSPIMQAILDAGYDWEEEVVGRLGKKVVVAAGPGKPRDRRFTWEQTLALLKTQPAGMFIYQGTIRPPASFHRQFGLDPAVIGFGENHPDLIEALAGKGGRRLFRVVDLKRGASMRATYRMQVLLYALQLHLILQEQKIDADADLETGAVWLGGEEKAEICDLRSIRPHLESFLRDDLPRILSQPVKDVDWHLYFRCEWCGYFDHCRDEMRATNSVSRLTQLSVNGKRHLVHEAGVRTLPELDKFLRRKDADEVLAECASLAGRRHHLRAQVDAFSTDKPVIGKASTPALPIWENVAVFITLQQEPLGKKIYLAGMLAQVGNKNKPDLFGDNPDPALFKPRVWVAAKDTPGFLAAVREQFIVQMHELLTRVHRFNQGKDWKEQLSVQCYAHSEHERSLVVVCLLEALADLKLAPRAMDLLFHFQGPDLLLTDDHPDKGVQYPLVVLLSVLGRLMALPIDVTYSLPESLKALGSTFTYKREDLFHFPLGPGLKPDTIYLAWNRGRTEAVKWITTQAQMHLNAVRFLLIQLREQVKGSLYAWPPKFSLPATANIKDPLLSKLAFFATYESVLGCLKVREHRAEAREVLELLGELIELEAGNPPTYKVVGDQALDLNEGFPSYLLVRDTPEGRRAQLEFNDYSYRDKPYGNKHRHRVVAGVIPGRPDKLGFIRSLDVKANDFDGYKPKKGDRFLLYQRYTDFNADKVVTHLKQLDVRGKGLFLGLVRDPVGAAASMPLPKAIEDVAAAEEKALDLTPSQLFAYRQVRNRRLLAVWGPPGTGKTHFIAAMILSLASAHAQAGKSFRVLVTAFTHVAIENVLRKLAWLQNELKFKAGRVKIGKSGGWRGQGAAPCEQIADKGMGLWLADAPLAVVGATVWACRKENESVAFDLVIIDEASQVRVPDSSIAVSRVAKDGRLVLAGDHMQLPPIVAGEYPDPAEGEPFLHRSIFELVLAQSGCANLLNPVGEATPGNLPVCQLLENWRMNDVLTSYAAGLIYGPRYVPASAEVRDRRIRLKPKVAGSELVKMCLDPEYPLVLISIEGAAAAKENKIEAGIVAGLVEALRERLLDAKGRIYAADDRFFRDGVFIVSPHHVQIGLIRKHLRDRREWSSPPFVDTVDKMQGQEADVVLVSYGVSDTEFALQEAEFIYGLNRLNVAVTRARSKCIVCLPAPLLAGTPEVLDIPEAEQGLAYMRRLAEGIEAGGETMEFDLGDGVTAKMMRTSVCFPLP